ncbi:MAG TPA: hypothetical protein VNS58_01990 [Puia sp.]|nr:hypothetical protein [Puia sp.]
MQREKANDILKILNNRITVVEKLPDYSNDPCLLKKEEEAYMALTEVPLPDIILDRIEGPSILKKTN